MTIVPGPNVIARELTVAVPGSVGLEDGGDSLGQLIHLGLMLGGLRAVRSMDTEWPSGPTSIGRRVPRQPQYHNRPKNPSPLRRRTLPSDFLADATTPRGTVAVKESVACA